MQHHPKEKKFNSALAASDGFQLNKREKDTNPGKAIIKSILKVTTVACNCHPYR